MLLRKLYALHKKGKLLEAIEYYENKEQHNLAINYYNKEVAKMENIFKDLSPYQFDQRLLYLEQLTQTYKDVKDTNEFKSIRAGVPAAIIVQRKNKMILELVMSAIKMSNPLYDITNISNDKALSFSIDSCLAPSEFIEIMDGLYRKISDFYIKYDVSRSYALNRVVYDVTVESGNVYRDLAKFLNELNIAILDIILLNLESAEKATLVYMVEYLKVFELYSAMFNDLNTMDMEQSDHIKNIIACNKLFTLDLLSKLEGMMKDDEENK